MLGLNMTEFRKEVRERIDSMRINQRLRETASAFLRESVGPKYSYNFFWLDRPIIQYPQDIVAMQEVIWSVRPDLIIETGIAHGGSLIFNASMLALLDMCDVIRTGGRFEPTRPTRKVLGVDNDIRVHNRQAIEAHPLASYIQMVEGSSIESTVIAQVRAVAEQFSRILVCLDSNHTHDHVLAELQAYAPLTSVGSYCVVFDTLIEDMPDTQHSDRPWGRGNNPMTAVRLFLEGHSEFAADEEIDNKLLISVAPNGFLKRRF